MNRPMETMVFTDGSTPHNGSPDAIGGIGVFYTDDHPDNYSECFYSNSQRITNNMMELMAIKKAIRTWIKQSSTTALNSLTIYTDSMYAINCVTKWASNWEKNGWTKGDGHVPENLTLIREIYDHYRLRPIQFIHCNSHLKPPTNKQSSEYEIWYGNYKADEMASSACKLMPNDSNVLNKKDYLR